MGRLRRGTEAKCPVLRQQSTTLQVIEYTIYPFLVHGSKNNVFSWERIGAQHCFKFPKRCTKLDNGVVFQSVGERHLATLTGSAANSAHKKSYASVTARKRMAASSRSASVAVGGKVSGWQLFTNVR